VDPPTLLDDLLEDSARVYHHHCAVIQSVFHARWLERLGDEIGAGQLRFPDANPRLVEAEARKRLQGYRQALRQKAREMLRGQQDERLERDRAIRAYVAAREAAPVTSPAIAA
jgi:hypothetical protein